MSALPSRKWHLALLVVILATIGAFLPPLVSAWLFAAEKPLVLLSGTEWVSVITLVTGLYIGGNVWQKNVEHNTERYKMSFNPLASGVGGTEEEDDSEKEA